MDFLAYALAIAVAWFFLSKLVEGIKTELAGDRGTRHCMTCGSEAIPKTHVKGSFLVELVLWLCLIVPGMIYSVWRISSKHNVCPSCGGATLVPLNSPAAANQRRTMQP